MRILIVAATPSEIEPFTSHFKIKDGVVNIGKLAVTVLISGVGMTATAYSMGRMLSLQKFDLAINAGIAGSFDRSLQIGETLNVKLDCFAELGAEDGEGFIPIDLLGFGKSAVSPEKPFKHTFLSALKSVNSISVNKVHGNSESIYTTVSRLNPQTESMEGAAFFYSCNQSSTSCVQLRAISNYVEPRDRASWNIPLAVKSLNSVLINLITKLQ